LCGAVVRVVLLAALIPGFGLSGAAAGAAIAVILEQALTVATALRLFQVSPGRLARRVVRPALAAMAMAGVLAVSGIGWSGDRSLIALVEATASGVVVYTAVLLASWIVAGRPEGAENDVMALARRVARR